MGFDAMIAALFADPTLTKAAEYLPQGSPGGIAVRVMARQPDALTGFGEGQLHTATTLFDVRTAEVPQPAIGDGLTVDGKTYIIQSEPTADRERLIWTLNMAVVE